MNKYLKYFTQFTNSVDFDKLWKEPLQLSVIKETETIEL